MKYLIILILVIVGSNSCLSQDLKLEIENLRLRNELNERKIIDLENSVKELKEIIKILGNGNKNLNPSDNTNSSTSNNSNTLKQASPTETINNSKSSQSYGQCKATTKAGTRCKRSATSSGYCWQHG